ncbi:putative ABC transport system permease protein [Duganella sp. CF402]|uniref:ABC transporter permease n=1 Tax=unclassified Duganella TaxID=2636909 RepID=UPI0008D57435|nr:MULTISPECIES: ABC transporter permease [unclassified Duganella]RZT05969.1 putative ABC transport system permease protein [Duganella sp. BK701]SEN15096.1 putative ABC transport system permease protein [Duganella sp. CF402]
MFQYYFLLGVRSLRRNPALTALMVLTLAIGVAASVATLTILHVMSGDPIPHKSDRLLVPLFDNGSIENYKPGDKINDDQLSYRDATNILNSKAGERRTAIYGIGVAIEPERKDIGAFNARGLAPTADFFNMFDAPFLHGQGWTPADDKTGADMVVLSRKLAEKLYGDADPVGKRMTLGGFQYQIVGVLNTWNVVPRFHRIIGNNDGAFSEEDELFIPFSSAIRHEFSRNGSTSCYEDIAPGFQAFLDSECTWIQGWIEIRSASDRAELQSFLDSYAVEQRKLGRLKRAAPNKLYDVREWLDYMKVVGNDNKLSAWLAFGFLVLCLVNTIGLLLAKFSVRAAEVGIRRALGASRREIFTQFLIETTVVGLVGGVLGLLLAFGALALIAMQSTALTLVAHMDWVMLLTTFGLAVLSAILAGLLPTWRACQVTPALQLKSQ